MFSVLMLSTTYREGLLLRVGSLPWAPTYNRGMAQHVVFDRVEIACKTTRMQLAGRNVPFKQCCASGLQQHRISTEDVTIVRHVAWATVVVVVDDSHIQRTVLATGETAVTQQVSHRPIKCQSRLWSQRGTKVNGSHHGENPVFRPTGIQIATKSYAALQAMAPIKSKRFIKPPYSI